MAGSRFIPPYGQFVTSAGLPYAGGSLFFYDSGTSTLAETWSDVGLTTPNTNPIVLDSAGNAGNVFLSPSTIYKVVLKDSGDNVVWTADPIQPVAPTSIDGIAWGGVSTGAANAQIIAATGYVANPGAAFLFVAGFANSGATNLTVNGSVYPAYQNGQSGPVAFSGGELQVANIYEGYFNPNLNSNAGGYQFDALTLQGLGVSSAMATVIEKTTIGGAAGAMGLAFGQCYFEYVNSTQVSLVPQGGAYITIAGVDYAIPSAGITANPTSCYLNGVAGQALTANTLYYVYAFNNSGTVTLDFSTTGHSTDTTAGNVGIEIKSGDSSRSLVGMVYPQAGPVFASSASQLYVISWFGKKDQVGINNFTTGRPTTSTSYIELQPEIRVNFLTWANQAVSCRVNGFATNSGTNTNIATALAFDSTTSPQDAYSEGSNGTSGSGVPVIVSGAFVLSEGLHYGTLLGLTGAGTATWSGGASPGSRTTLSVTVKG